MVLLLIVSLMHVAPRAFFLFLFLGHTKSTKRIQPTNHSPSIPHTHTHHITSHTHINFSTIWICMTRRVRLISPISGNSMTLSIMKSVHHNDYDNRQRSEETHHPSMHTSFTPFVSLFDCICSLDVGRWCLSASYQ